MFFLYQLLTTILFPFYVLVILIRLIQGKEDKKRFLEKILIKNKTFFYKSKFTVWFHGASIGEIKSIFPIVNKLLKKDKRINIIVTSVTLSSGNLIKQEYGNNKRVKHQYFPFDNFYLVKKFLSKWKPNLVMLIDSEIWPNFIIEIKKRNIPLTLINGRITNKSFKRWYKINFFAKYIFSYFDTCIAASKNSLKNLKALNARNAKFYGNLKFIPYKETNKKLKKQTLNFLNKKKVWCAASTHRTEEVFCMKTHLEIKKKHKNLLTIIIPRHINRTDEIIEECKKFNLKTEVLKNEKNIKASTEIVIINSFNLLSKFYEYCKIVFIGKSLVKKLKSVGGQNPLEAARKGCKVYHGPYVYNFFEIYEFLKLNNVSVKIINHKDLAKNIIQDLKNSQKINTKIIKKINQHGEKILNIVLLQIYKYLKI